MEDLAVKVTPAELAAMCRQLDEILDQCAGEVAGSELTRVIEHLYLDATNARNLLVRVRDEGLGEHQSALEQDARETARKIMFDDKKGDA